MAAQGQRAPGRSPRPTPARSCPPSAVTSAPPSGENAAEVTASVVAAQDDAARAGQLAPGQQTQASAVRHGRADRRSAEPRNASQAPYGEVHDARRSALGDRRSGPQLAVGSCLIVDLAFRLRLLLSFLAPRLAITPSRTTARPARWQAASKDDGHDGRPISAPGRASAAAARLSSKSCSTRTTGRHGVPPTAPGSVFPNAPAPRRALGRAACPSPPAGAASARYGRPPARAAASPWAGRSSPQESDR